MRHALRSVAIASTIAAAVAFGVGAAEASTVKVALFDMTAVAPGAIGQGKGIGMMGRSGFAGPGMMGFGGQGFGQGMMGFGGQGMIGFGGQGLGTMRPGMIGAGMMGAGMMSVRVDQGSVKSGVVTFDVVNWSRSLVHEMVVVAVDSPDAPLPYDFDKHEVVEDQVKIIGETDELQPGQSKTIEFNLPAGDYLLICNVPGHYGAGMQTAFTVTD